MKLEEQLQLFILDGVGRYWYFKYNQDMSYSGQEKIASSMMPVYHNEKGLEVRYGK
jgi:hypothetical protein